MSDTTVVRVLKRELLTVDILVCDDCGFGNLEQVGCNCLNYCSGCGLPITRKLTGEEGDGGQ